MEQRLEAPGAPSNRVQAGGDAAGLGRARATAFIVPAMLMIAAFLLFPAVWTIYLGLTDYRLTGLAAYHTKGLITRARLAFALRWSLRRRLHQARARWHHYSTRLQAVTGTG